MSKHAPRVIKYTKVVVVSLFLLIGVGLVLKKYLFPAQVAQVAEIGIPATCQSFQDNFDSTSLNASAWTPSNRYLFQRNDSLNFRLPSQNSNQKSDLTYNTLITGDFLLGTTVRSLSIYPATKYGSAELFLTDSNGQKYNVGLRRGNNLTEMTSWHLTSPNAIGKNDNVTVKAPFVIQFMRRGSSLTASYRLANSTIATTLYEYRNVQGPLSLSLHTASYEQRPSVTAIFSDFSLLCF